MTYLLRAVLLLCVALVAAPAVAHPGHDHKVMGVITAIDGDHVTVKTNAGHERTFQITEKTKILRGKLAGARADLVVGLRLVVNVGDGNEPLKAKSVQYAAAAAAKTRSGT
jgi:hypothetical protein